MNIIYVSYVGITYKILNTIFVYFDPVGAFYSSTKYI